jgi:hypothetical protein
MKDMLKVSSNALFSVLNSFRRLSEGERIWLSHQENVLIIPASGMARFTLSGAWEVVWDNTTRCITDEGEPTVTGGWKAMMPTGDCWTLDYSSGLGDSELSAIGGAGTRAGHLEVCRVDGSILKSWFLVQLLEAEKSTPASLWNGGAARKGSRVGQLREALREELNRDLDVLRQAAEYSSIWNWKVCADAERSMEEVLERVVRPKGALKGYKWQVELGHIRKGLSLSRFGALERSVA